MRVLVVDDSEVVRSRLAEMLSVVEGVEVVGEAVDAVEALELQARMQPDTLILDIRMPGGNGIDVLQEVKRSYPGTSVIILTNYPYDQIRSACNRLGADYFFDKSSEFEKIPQALLVLRNNRETQARDRGEISGQTPESG